MDAPPAPELPKVKVAENEVADTRQEVPQESQAPQKAAAKPKANPKLPTAKRGKGKKSPAKPRAKVAPKGTGGLLKIRLTTSICAATSVGSIDSALARTVVVCSKKTASILIHSSPAEAILIGPVGKNAKGLVNIDTWEPHG